MFMILILVFLIGLLIGAYSHKWLQSVTGAPDKLTPANAGAAVDSLVSHAKGAAYAAVDTAAEAAKTAFHDATPK